MRVLAENHSTFYDMKSDVQFSSVLDRRSGCFVGVAVVSEEKAAEFEGRASFRVLTDPEYLEMTEAPTPIEPTEPLTGDPLGDAAIGGDAPPAPPSSEGSQPPKSGDGDDGAKQAFAAKMKAARAAKKAAQADAPPAPPEGA